MENERGAVQQNVSEIYIHPDWDVYDGKYDADISIFVLSENITFTNFIRPICLPEDDVIISNVTGSIVGWGFIENGTSSHLDFPSQGVTKALNDTYCYLTDYGIAMFSSARTFCGGAGSGSPSRGEIVFVYVWMVIKLNSTIGDSGGGFFVMSESKWVQYGIISALRTNSVGQVNLDSFGIYTNVKEFKNWIVETVGISGCKVMTMRMKMNLNCVYYFSHKGE